MATLGVNGHQRALERVLTSEAHWLAHDHERGGLRGVHAGLWAADGKNVPESNLWNGAILWRMARAGTRRCYAPLCQSQRVSPSPGTESG